MPSVEERYVRLVSGQSRGLGASLARAALTAAELPYRGIMGIRNRLYDGGLCKAHDLGQPTISVGNITAGGTGKTPVVRWLASRLTEAGRHPAVLLRGYRKAGAQISDEARMLSDALPGACVIANPDRVEGARQALSQTPTTDLFILDDGMQHRRVRRDLDVVLIHAGSPFGFGHVHPRGLLRESLGGLSRAGAIILTHASEIDAREADALQSTIKRYSSAPIFHCDHVNRHLRSGRSGERMPLELLEQQRFVAFAGIGRPESMEQTLRRLGDRMARFERFPDHHAYAAADLARLGSLCEQHRVGLLVTTEKDWTKLQNLPTPVGLPPILCLELGIEFWESEEQQLMNLILAKLAGRNS